MCIRVSLTNIQLPDWDKTLLIASRLCDILPLGYIGCDFIYDSQTGTNLLEVNARPGLAVQIANKTGLKPRLEKIEAHLKNVSNQDYKTRVTVSQTLFNNN
jgi:glutathione synthase/RimK-type ligase-like ATP-grasp enzyme